MVLTLWHGNRRPPSRGSSTSPVSVGTLPTRVPASQPGPPTRGGRREPGCAGARCRRPCAVVPPPAAHGRGGGGGAAGGRAVSRGRRPGDRAVPAVLAGRPGALEFRVGAGPAARPLAADLRARRRPV